MGAGAMTPEPSVPLSAIRALVQQWRENSERWVKRAIEIDNVRVSGHFEGSAAQAAYCADQLAALCPAPPEDRK
jgi:hypothetical protein